MKSYLEEKERWYEHVPDSVSTNDEVKSTVRGIMNIQCHHVVLKYHELKREIARMWNIRTVQVIPTVVDK